MNSPSTPVAGRKKNSERKSRKVEFMVTDYWYATFEAEAKSWGLELSAYIRVACEEKRRNDLVKRAQGEDAD